MEGRGRSQRWKMHLPEFKHSRTFPSPTTTDGDRGKTEGAADGAGPHKSVTMAATSRYLTDRQYVTRKPLFSAEQYTSILKKTHPQDKQLALSRGEEEKQRHTDMNFMTRAELTPESFSLSHSDISFSSASREDLSSPLAVSKLRASRCHQELTVGSSYPGSRSAQRSLSSSILEVQKLNPPPRPLLTSTVLYPTYTPRSRLGKTQLRLGGEERGGGGETKLFSSVGHPKEHSMSPHQANYWACAIPKALPPSPDRRSASWDPNREYQTLLDYTYPLRPGHMVTEWDSSKIQEDSLLQSDPNLQDSGIELDHICSSTSLSGLGFTVSGAGQTRERSSPCGGQRSPDLQAYTTSDGLPSSALPSLTDPVGLSSDSLDNSRSRGAVTRCRGDGHIHRRHRAPSACSSTSFIRSTSVLPQSRHVCREVDEEFWPLPEQLEELQLLSRQVREVTDQLSRPVTASWESLEPGTTSVLSSITLPDRQEAEDKEEESEVKEPDGIDQDADEMGREDMSSAQTADHRDSGEVRSSGAWAEPVGGVLSQSSLKEVEALVEQLRGLTLHGSQGSRQEYQEQSDSLTQHIQVFCSHLEQLIQRLYTVSEKMEQLAAPTVDIDHVKSSLAEYQSLQREVSGHQPLTSCILHTGQLLLNCINTTSPFLRDTLLMIERQSGALETHTEHFFSSILSAMDSLTQPDPVQQCTERDPGLVGGPLCEQTATRTQCAT